MPKRSKKSATPKALVIPDTRNATSDFYIPLKLAKELFEQGKLAQDLTNQAWTTVNGTSVQEIKALAQKE